MPIKRKKLDLSAESDMTPMIDMTFQLIAFFMVLLNFGEGEQDARIKLPSSELAKPPDAPLESPIVMQLSDRGTVYFNGAELGIEAISGPLLQERQVMEAYKKNVADATIIIRADAAAPTGVVQELIKKCQENQFQKFALRVKQERKPGT